ncbi:MAG: T9SS type A sorting domain-containing protein [Bacteroidales bacterium]|nr:T9SS type A sorting domain-containing protein [Bacteroidales bacterium]
MKKLFLLFIVMIMGFGSFAQTVLFEDDMESYTVGDFLAVEDPLWYQTWSNNPGSGEDAKVVDAFASSPSKSALVDETGGPTDLILKLGNKTAGQYELSWWMYIETGFAGYYNIQHFESPGIEWAMECYMNTDGTIDLDVGGITINGTYPKDTWFEVMHEIDIDADNIKLYIDGTLFHEWPLSYQGGGTSGTLQLGGIDFFAGAQGADDPKYYFDDVMYVQTGGGGDPEITVTPDELSNWCIAGATTDDMLTIQNTGESDLDWDLSIIYDLDVIPSTPVTPGPSLGYTAKNPITGASVDPTPVAGGPSQTDATAVLHYDGDNASAIGWNTVPVTVTVAARFPSSMTLPYAGMELKSVEVFINDLNTSGGNAMTVKIYGMGNSYEPGALLYEQAFTPNGATWNTITLTSPVMITGEDIWVGYNFTQVTAGIFTPGTDDGANYNSNGDYLSTGVGWSHLGNNPALMYNWNIRANLEGDPIEQWLSATPTSGFLPPLGSTDVDVMYDATNLDAGVYNAFIRFLSNDPATPILDVPVELTVAGVGIDENAKANVMIYPNPAQDYLVIQSTNIITGIQVSDFSGKVLYIGTDTKLNVRNLASGIYFVRTTTDKGTSNMKFIKK